MAGTRMTRAESKAATREELIAAARRVLVERGYIGASLELVAGEAGYTKGAVYSAFGSKGRMFLAVYEREQEGRLAAIERHRTDERRLRDWYGRVRAERAWSVALLEFRVHAARDPELNAAFASLHTRYLERFAELTGVEPDDAMTMVALGNGFVLEQLALSDRDLEDVFVEAAIGLTATRR
jgi:AcrR family transcriptional regulator